MNAPQTIASCLLLLLGCGRAHAQQAPAPPHPAAQLDAVRVPIHTSADDLGLAYGTWAAGDGYKASFQDGMTFVPYLGSDYPHNQPLSWRTFEARVGDASLLGDGETAPRGVRATDWRYEYHHQGIVEAYDVRVEGLEQTFVVDHLPQRGDLVVRGAITSAMHATNGDAAHGALTFCDEQGRELVRYGEAFAIDAAGARLAIPTQHVDGEVTLRVPAAWLATAQLPVTIDPLLSAVTVSGGSNAAVLDVDVSAIAGNAFVFSRAASATDSDCFGLHTHASFSNQGTVWSDITTSWSADQPCCAASADADSYVFAWRRYFPNLSPTRSVVRMHAHALQSLAYSTSFETVPTPNGSNDWRPDIGSSPYGNTLGAGGLIYSRRFLLVFQREFNNTSDFANTATSDVEMWWCELTPGASTTTFLHTETVRSSATIDYERPNVRQEGLNNEWPIVWQQFDNLLLFGNWNVSGAMYGISYQDQNQPVELAPITPPQQQSGSHQTAPRIAGGSLYAVTYTQSAAGLTGKIADAAGETIELEGFRSGWSHSPLAASVMWETHETLRTSPTRSWLADALTFDAISGSHFVLGYRSIGALPAAFFARIGGYGSIVEGETDGDALLHIAFGETPSPIAATFDTGYGEWRLAYGLDGPFGHPLRAHVLQNPSAPLQLNSGYGCSPATLSWSGSQLSGARNSRVRVTTNGETAPFHLLLVSTSLVDVGVLHPIVAPGCRLLVDTLGPGYIGMLVAGPSAPFSFAFPLPDWLPSLDLYFQGWPFDGAELRSTSRLTVPIVR